MSIRQKGNGFEVRVYVGIDPGSGKKKFATKYVGIGVRPDAPDYATKKIRAEKEARRIESQMLHQVETNTYVPPAKQTVGEYLGEWLEKSARPNVKPGSYRRYEEIVRLTLRPHLGAVRLDKLTPQHVAGMLSELHDQGASARGRQYAYRTLHRALEVAVRWGLVGRNVCDAVEPPRTEEKTPVGLSESQVEALLQAAKEDRLYPLFLTAVHTGMRKGGLLGLRWEDVDLDEGMAVVRQTLERSGRAPAFGTPKNRKIRVVPLSPEVIEALRQLRVDQEIGRATLGANYRDHGLVFCQIDGRPLDGRSLVRWHLKRLVRKVNEKADEAEKKAREERSAPTTRPVRLPANLRFHDLRHTFVSRALQAGANPRAVSEIAGHHDPGFTLKRYAHALNEDMKEAVRKLGHHLRRTARPESER